jgi:hypothetical protein
MTAAAKELQMNKDVVCRFRAADNIYKVITFAMSFTHIPS